MNKIKGKKRPKEITKKPIPLCQCGHGNEQHFGYFHPRGLELKSRFCFVEGCGCEKFIETTEKRIGGK